MRRDTEIDNLRTELSSINRTITARYLQLARERTDAGKALVQAMIDAEKDSAAKLDATIAKALAAPEPKSESFFSDPIKAKLEKVKENLAYLQAERNRLLLNPTKPAPARGQQNDPIQSRQEPSYRAAQRLPRTSGVPYTPNRSVIPSASEAAGKGPMIGPFTPSAARYTRPDDEFFDERDLREYQLYAPLPPNQPGPGNVYGVGNRLYDADGYLIEFVDDKARQDYIREMAASIKEDDRQSRALGWYQYYAKVARDEIFKAWRAKFDAGTATLKDHPGYRNGGSINDPGSFSIEKWVEIRKKQDQQMIDDLGGRTHDLVSDTLSWIKLAEDQAVRLNTALTGESREAFMDHMSPFERSQFDSLREGLIRLTLPDNPPYKWEDWEDEKFPPKITPNALSTSSSPVLESPDSDPTPPQQ